MVLSHHQQTTALTTPHRQKSVCRTKRRTVKLITQFFPPDFAATGQLLEELARQLTRQGMDVEVFTGQPGYAFNKATAPRQERIERVFVQRSRLSQLWPQRIRGQAMNGVLFVVRAIMHLLRHGRKREHVLLLSTAPPFLPFIGYLMNRLFQLPYVVILYDLYPDIAIELDVVAQRHIAARMWRWMNQLLWRRAEAIIVLSPAMKARIVNHCPAVADKVSVIHSWADPNLIKPIEKRENWFALRYGLVEPFTVLYSGNMGRCHDIDTIFEAAKRLKGKSIRFLCIGGGAKREPLQAAVKASGLEAQFLFLPYQDKADVGYSMTACDLSLVSVSEGMESLVAPSKLYPALASGRPIAVVCPEGNYLERLVTQVGCGAAFRNGDSEGLAQFIEILANDSKVAFGMGKRGRAEMEESFTPEAIGHKYFEVMESVRRGM